MAVLTPPLKWVGGKTQLLPALAPVFSSAAAAAPIQNYVEPFLGGGATLLAALSARAAGTFPILGTVRASDANARLVNFWLQLRDNPEGLIAALQDLLAAPGALAEANYYTVRDAANSPGQPPLVAAARFLFLNKTCFRGLYREGPNGFNVPYGHYKNPGVLDAAHLRNVSALIQGVDFQVADFRAALATAGPADFVYVDPPYVPEKATSFKDYTAAGFSDQSHTDLFAELQRLRAAGTRVVLSNSDVPRVRSAFPTPTWTTQVVSARRAIHSKDPAARTNEVIITSY